MKKLIVLFFLLNISLALGQEIKNNDGIWCSHNGRDIKYTNQDFYNLAIQCDYATDEIALLLKNGYTSAYFFENFPYFSNFHEKCVDFLNSLSKDKNGNVLSFESKDCKSFQEIIYSGTEFDVKVKQESIKINNLVKKVKQNRS